MLILQNTGVKNIAKVYCNISEGLNKILTFIGQEEVYLPVSDIKIDLSISILPNFTYLAASL